MFSKDTQPLWFRIAKWTVFIGLAYILHGTQWLWGWVIGIPIAGLAMHSVFRWKTKGWTRSWGGWKSDE
jgi:hypothetical protein